MMFQECDTKNSNAVLGKIVVGDKTLQQVSDEIALRLILQGGQCFDPVEETCVYSDGNGKHCAVGWLLDDWSSAPFEGKTVDGILSSRYSLLAEQTNGQWIEDNVAFLGVLQTLHDSLFLSESESCLLEMENKYGLDTTLWREYVELNLGKGE